jgi:hypothetical protein
LNCQPDCKDVAHEGKTFNTPGYHEFKGKCTKDKNKPNPNELCDTHKSNYSKNKVNGKCEPDCFGPDGKSIDPIKAAHWFNGLCLPDANTAPDKANKECAKDKAGMSLNLLG